MTAILFGSISTIADTSELQRQAFNDAFAEHGLDWQWSREDYRSMLDSNGGANRIADYAKSRGEDVDSKAVHATKSAKFQESVATSGITARPGVLDTMASAKKNDLKVALVTTTSKENIDALLSALPDISASSFDLIVDSTSVETPKPSSASYEFALSSLHESADNCVAIEDNVGGLKAAHDAGVPCIAFPNENTAGGDFATAVARFETLEPRLLEPLAGRGK